MQSRTLLLTVLAMLPAVLAGQGNISGIVRDKDNGQPVQDATVVIYGESHGPMGVSTDSKGAYSIKGFPRAGIASRHRHRQSKHRRSSGSRLQPEV